ncbi:MAG TPA: flagellar biosynthesis anti-sigma factor FlgM [Lachnospiraceae bacterium]|nr:flagellar biosynthesis anti-sigma factor FlgM [Lachnospiraceae bacterium]
MEGGSNMRIGNFASVQALYPNTKPAQTNTAKTKGFSDAVSISGEGKDLAIARKAVENASDIRTELVESIKDRVKNGTYDVDPDKFADRIFEKFV